MLIKITDPFPVSSSEITPEALYAGRRRFLKQLGLVAGASIGGLRSVAAVVDAGAQLPVGGAPLRLTLPWKYGFKSIKSIVRMQFAERQPLTSWNESAPRDYGFYSNVNPAVDHPRWSQAQERRLGEVFKRKTFMFNGYPEVASLYTGMDLRTYY
jgi:hypothetical protein